MIFKLTFMPQLDSYIEPLGSPIIVKGGSVLYINGEAFDFGPLTDGADLSASAITAPWFLGLVQREEDTISINMLLPHGMQAPEDRRFPEPVLLVADGMPVKLADYGLTNEEVTQNAE